TLGGNYIRVAQSIRVEEYIPRYEGSVLLVHGDADGAVPVQCSIDAAKQYKNAELAIIAGDGHCYENHLDQAVKAVRGWMEKQIREEKKA
ncbi:MAG: feruloyl esterase, partial [Clostridia bacterium]|nr:feruloyl esterase [Clostridia bacterium]